MRLAGGKSHRPDISRLKLPCPGCPAIAFAGYPSDLEKPGFMRTVRGTLAGHQPERNYGSAFQLRVEMKLAAGFADVVGRGALREKFSKDVEAADFDRKH